MLRPWRSDVVEALRPFDFVVASGLGPVYAQFSGRPWAFLTTGGDLTVRPFPVRFLRYNHPLRARLGSLAVGVWQRRAIRRAPVIWTQPFSPFQRALSRLGVTPDRSAWPYLPIVVDTEAFAPRPRPLATRRVKLPAIVDDADFVVFSPSRVVMNRSRPMVESGQWKGSDILLRGFAALVHARRVARPLLLLIDNGSREVATARRLAASLEITQQVVWLQGPRRSGFDRAELIELYALADVVVDEFGVGWFGYVVLEGLAMGKPVVSHVEEAVMRDLYPSHPICSARTPEDVTRQLSRLCADPALRNEIGRRGRAWIEQHHSPEGAGKRYTEAIMAALEPRGGGADGC